MGLSKLTHPTVQCAECILSHLTTNMHHLAMAVCPFLDVKTAEPFSGLQATLHFGQLKCQLKMSFYILP